MARTPSNMIPLGTVAPGFTLYDTVSGDDLTLYLSYAVIWLLLCFLSATIVHL